MLSAADVAHETDAVGHIGVESETGGAKTVDVTGETLITRETDAVGQTGVESETGGVKTADVTGQTLTGAPVEKLDQDFECSRCFVHLLSPCIHPPQSSYSFSMLFRHHAPTPPMDTNAHHPPHPIRSEHLHTLHVSNTCCRCLWLSTQFDRPRKTDQISSAGEFAI